jgi:hypothetical protein
MELAGLEPATSWVRSVRDVDPEGAKGMVQPFPRQVRAGISPPLPCSTHHQLTTPPAVRPLDALTDVGRSKLAASKRDDAIAFGQQCSDVRRCCPAAVDLR